MNKFIELLGSPEAQTVIITVIAVVFAAIKKFSAIQKYNLTRALECIEAGVRETYSEYVRSVKQASEDGKLTEGERSEALNRALTRAREYAASEGIDLAKIYAKEYLPVIIEKIVAGRKTKLPLVSVPGLEPNSL